MPLFLPDRIPTDMWACHDLAKQYAWLGSSKMGESRHRAIWLSDGHFGSRGSKTEFLLDFIKNNDADYIYLLGDIIDGWRLKRI